MRKPCLDCGAITEAGSRCERCRAERNRQRCANRPWYRGAWRKISEAARMAHPYCAVCGATDDLTVDHVAPRSLEKGVRVLCRRHNSSKGGRHAA